MHDSSFFWVFLVYNEYMHPSRLKMFTIVWFSIAIVGIAGSLVSWESSRGRRDSFARSQDQALLDTKATIIQEPTATPAPQGKEEHPQRDRKTGLGMLPPPPPGGDRVPNRVERLTSCPDISQAIIPPTIDRIDYLPDHDEYCIEPTMIIIHWSGGWSSAQETFNVLRDRGLFCHFATDENEQLLGLPMYGNIVKRAWCAAGVNSFSLHDEITGSNFDDYLSPDLVSGNFSARGDGSAEYTARLLAMTELSIETTCWAMRKYNIPYTQIFGHFEVTEGKPDPGPQYLSTYIDLVKNECGE